MAVKATAAVTLSTVVDVVSCTRYYLLQGSTLAQPAKPTARNPGGNWNDAEPAYTGGSTNSLYTCDLTVFSDGTWSYSSVSLSSAYEAAKEAYNRAVAAEGAAARALSNTEIIVGTQTAASPHWTGEASFITLTDGQQIVYWLPYAGTSTSADLNLTLANGTTTGAIPCYYSGTTRITTHYAAGNAIHLTYRVNASVSGTAYTGWWADANYNTNTNNYDRLQIDNYVKAKTAITAKKLIVGDETGYFNLTADVTFDITKPVLYAASAIKANATGTGNYIAYPAIAMTTAIASSWTGIINQSAYLKGTLAGQSFTVAATDWMTCEPLDDGTESVYMLIGKISATSATSLYLYPEHPIYRFVNGALSSVSQTAYEAKMTADQNSENISTLVQRVNEVDLKLTEESIIALVRGSAEYRSDIDNTSRFEALQTQITQALTSIDLRVSKAEMETYLRLITAGIVIGKSTSAYNLLLDDNALHIQQSGTDISKFQKNQLTVENIRLSSPSSTAERYSVRTAPDGGVMFVMEG